MFSARHSEVRMLQRTTTFTYATLLRILGGCFLVFGLYVVAVVLTAQIGVGQSSSVPMITYDSMDLENYIFYGGPLLANLILPGAYQVVYLFGFASPGPLLWVGLGILCVSLTTRRVLVAYLGLQIALWMISASVWDPILWLRGSNQYGLGAIGPFFLVTLALSLVLLALYKPVTHGLRRLMVPQG
jgi:hypothetical protein